MFSVASAVMFFSLHTDICKEIVSEAKDDEFDMNTCELVYIRGAWLVTIAMAINMLLKLHFAFAIHSYTKQVKQNIDEEETMNSVIVTPYPTAYISSTTTKDTKEQPIYVAGQEYIPDEKKQQAEEQQ
jgi:hypothetical protein